MVTMLATRLGVRKQLSPYSHDMLDDDTLSLWMFAVRGQHPPLLVMWEIV